MSTVPKEFLHAVRNQYESLPYPYRDVSTEREALMGNEAYSLAALTHLAWDGRRDLRKGARILVAGQGTGDVTIFFAEQLRGHDVEIIGLDFSLTSIEVCKARLAARGLDNVRHVHASILDLPKLGLGTFDVIESAGVLHHLADPDAGLKALSDVLADDGIMAIMVYGYYGRIAVYMVQEMMRSLVTPDMAADERVALCKEFLQAIPNGHWLMYNNENFKVDIREPSGAGIYDLFLHPQDRAYTVPQIYDWVEGAGLQLQSFYGVHVGDVAYDPSQYSSSPALRARFDTLPERERHRIAELMHGHMNKHSFYAVKQKKTPAQLADDMVPHFGSEHRHEQGFAARVSALLAPRAVGEVYTEQYHTVDMPPLIITKYPLTHEILARIDTVRSVRGIFDAMVQDGVLDGSDGSYQRYRTDLEHLFREMHSRFRLFLRHESLAPYITVPAIMQRLEQIQPITPA